MISGVEEARYALEADSPAVIWRKCVVDTVTPIGAALRLMKAERGDYLLESVEGGETRGRYSILGLDPDLVMRARNDVASINRDWRSDRGAFEDIGVDSVQAVRDLVKECQFDVPDDLPPALACLVGYFGYETIGLVEKVPLAPGAGLGLPTMMFVRPTIVLVFDNLSQAMFCVAPLWPSATEVEGTIGDGVRRIETTLEQLAASNMEEGEGAKTGADRGLELRATLPTGAFEQMVERAKKHIVAGDIFQVVLSQAFECPFELPPIALYRALRRVNPSPFLFFLDLPDCAIVGSSPEILVRMRDDKVTIRPIAGTRPRGRDIEEDKRAERDLLADEKERAEHLMLLDLGRNDIGRVSVRNSVEVTESFAVERYSHVMHIVSNVEGTLDPSCDALDAVYAGFPAGTVSGAPKVRACQLIAELERDRRGPYAGGVGYFGPDGSLDSCIVLRTGIVKDRVLHIQAGAGIVADSDPAYEQRECEAKAGALFAAAQEAYRFAREETW